jgi:hypothetical protein
LSYPWRFRAGLMSALEQADRVTIDFNTWPDSVRAKNSLPVLPSFEEKDREAISALVGRLDFRLGSPGECKCYGDVLLRFYRGDHELAAMSYHHQETLRWRDSGWHSDVSLTADARNALENWISRAAGKPFAQLLVERSDLEHAWSESRSKTPETRPAAIESTTGLQEL